MFASHEWAIHLLILTAVLTLSACSRATATRPTITAVASFSAIATGSLDSSVLLPTATPTNTRVPSPQLPGPTGLATLSPSNSAVATTLARTPQPTPLATPLANETGIVPGQTEAEVQAVLGQPGSKDQYRGMEVWIYRSSQVPTLRAVNFSNGRVSEISLLTPGLTTEMVVAQYGPPELVVFFPQVQLATPEPPPAAPSGKLVYPSRGLHFEYFCWPTRKPPCTGVPRDVEISVKFYFPPTTIRDWLAQQVLPPGRAELRPWTGFSN